MRKKIVLSWVLLFLATFLTGCWDRVEIEERGFVIGVAVDLAEGEGEEDETRKESAGGPKGKERYAVTFQFVVPEGLQADSGGGEDPYFNLTTESYTMMQAVRQLATRTSRSPHFTHIKALFISEEVARKGRLPDIIDFYFRDHEMRRGTKVMIAKGKARDVLDIKQPVEKLPVMYIVSVAENTHRTARMYPIVRIGDVHEDLLHHNSYALPRIVSSRDEVKIAGTAVMKGVKNQMVGWLGEEETIGLNCIVGKVEGGIEQVQVEDNLVVYEYRGKTGSIEADVSDKENIKFTITIESEGQIPEAKETVDWLEPKVVRMIEKKINEETLRITNLAVKKLHKEFKTDAMGLGQYLYYNHPEVWKDIKDDWDIGKNYFAQSTIKLKAKAIVRNSGVINKSEVEK